MPVHRPFQIHLLKESEYQKRYKEAFEKVKYSGTFTEDAHRAEFQQFDRTLRQALSLRWDEDSCGTKDFAVMDTGEWSGTWHHCGGIYSNRISCPEYVETIVAVISKLPHAALWTYHTAIELMNDDEPVLGFGECFIRAGALHVPKDDNDYLRVFGRRA